VFVAAVATDDVATSEVEDEDVDDETGTAKFVREERRVGTMVTGTPGRMVPRYPPGRGTMVTGLFLAMVEAIAEVSVTGGLDFSVP